MLALLVGCVGVLATASEVERAGLPPLLDAAGAKAPLTERQQVTVPVPWLADPDSWIAFTGAGRNGTPALYVVTPDGTDLRQIYRGAPGSASRGVGQGWRQHRVLHLAEPFGRGTGEPVPPGAGCVAVPPHRARASPTSTSRPKRSPDGRTLAFVRIHDAGSHRAALMTVDVISGLSSEVVGFEANVQLGIDWSPDGHLLAYTSNPGGGPTSDLWVVAADGSQSRQLTHLPEGWTASSPTFSPDGTRIAMSRQASGWAEIAVAELTGGVPEAVVGFRNLVPRELDWGPAVGPR